jgi:hypothetical protein
MLIVIKPQSIFCPFSKFKLQIIVKFFIWDYAHDKLLHQSAKNFEVFANKSAGFIGRLFSLEADCLSCA